jgi:hypothetical protein
MLLEGICLKMEFVVMIQILTPKERPTSDGVKWRQKWPIGPHPFPRSRLVGVGGCSPRGTVRVINTC